MRLFSFPLFLARLCRPFGFFGESLFCKVVGNIVDEADRLVSDGQEAKAIPLYRCIASLDDKVALPAIAHCRVILEKAHQSCPPSPATEYQRMLNSLPERNSALLQARERIRGLSANLPPEHREKLEKEICIFLEIAKHHGALSKKEERILKAISAKYPRQA